MTKHIFESPDGGKTVYRREIGSDQRQLHSVEPELDEMLKQWADNRLWDDIVRVSKTDAALKDLVDQVKVYYKLKYL